MKKLLSNFLHWKGDLKVVPMFLIVLLSSNLIIAQNKVRGTVKDATGVSIPGANVNVVGVSKGVSTGFDGQYEIDVPNNATLSFSFIGYVTKKVAVNGAKELNVLLTPTSEDLKEVVVNVGYGTQKRKRCEQFYFFCKSQGFRKYQNGERRPNAARKSSRCNCY